MKNTLLELLKIVSKKRLMLLTYTACTAMQLGVFFVTPVFSATNYYISPSGKDTNNGLTEGTPWATFAYSYKVLTAGDTLILLDGIYNQQLSPTISGSLGSPITFKAKNRGKAIIQMISDGSAISLYTSYPYTHTVKFITIDGLIARGKGEYSAITVGSDDTATEAQMTNNIVIKNTGAFGSSSLTNCVVWSIGNNAIDILHEDIFSYGIGRKALQAFGSKRVTIRRAVLRYDWWDGSSYKINDPRPTFSGYNTEDSVFENIIVMDSAPDPPGASSDKAAFVASGNVTPAYVTHSARNKYRGLLALNYYGNGVEVNGGSGDTPNEEISFKDIVLWKVTGAGFNIQDNDNGTTLEYATVGYSATSHGIRVNPSPSSTYGIHNEIIRNVFSTHNSIYGWYYDSPMVSVFQDNTATFNNDGGTIEGSYAPTMNYLVKPTMVAGHERGGVIVNRYVDGNLTSTPLWPWPNEDLIKQHMCNAADLVTAHRVASNGEGWEPAWCASSKTLTRYIWEYLGTPTPAEIYSNAPQILNITKQ